MSGNSVLLDTNAVVALLDGNSIVTSLLDGNVLYISFITELESLSYQKLSPTETKTVESFINDCIVLELNSEIKRAAIALRRKYKLKLPDAIIVGTALYHKLPVISADKTLSKIEEIEVIRFKV